MSENSVALPSYVHLSNAQYGILQATMFFSGGLSMFGAISIIYLIVQRRKYNELYHRIMLGLSFVDFVVSIALAFQPYAVRSDTGLPYAVGNANTCEAAGALMQFYLASYIYSAELSIYFLMTVRYRMRPKEISKWLEPYIHILPFGVAIYSGVAGIYLDAFNPSILLGVCDLVSYPFNCLGDEDVPCLRPKPGTAGLGYTAMLAVPLSALIGIGATWLVFWTVRVQLQSNSRFFFNESQGEAQRRRTKAVSVQAILYTCAFLNGFVIAIFVVTIDTVYTPGVTDASELSGNPAIFAATFLTWLFFPIQGFYNFLIYIRPRLIRWKKIFPSKSWFWILQQIYTGASLPRIGISVSGSNALPRTTAQRTSHASIQSGQNSRMTSDDNDVVVCLDSIESSSPSSSSLYEDPTSQDLLDNGDESDEVHGQITPQYSP